MTLYPLKLTRFLSPRLWGGPALLAWLAIDYQGEEALGESWEVYEKNRVLNGPLAGETLGEVAARLGQRLVGSTAFARYGDSFPLLAKFIGAREPLSVQVHPSDAYAHVHEAASGFHGKEEAWLILQAEPGASILWGFKERLSADEVRRLVAEKRLEEAVNRVPVAPGDVIYNPAGTLHAIGAGILLFEIQQSSDLTYRLYDYGRRDAKGELRELHLDKALEVLDLTPGVRAKVRPRALGEGKTALVETPHFAVERWALAGSLKESSNGASAEIITVLEGGLTLRGGGEALALAHTESCVLPAALGSYTVEGEGTLLRCYVPA